MIVQTNTDDNISGSEALARHIEGVVADTLGHFTDHITRVEVHLSDENAQKGGRDKRCTMEARIKNHQPLAATADAETLEQAIDLAAEKLCRSLNNTLGRLNNH